MATRQENIKKINENRIQTTRRKILNCVKGMFADEYRKKSGAWHYGKISEETGISRQIIAKYIKQFKEEGILD
jgi:predicted transcriptional regulator